MCVGSNKNEIEAILTECPESGVENIFALSGGPPYGLSHFKQPSDGLKNATELVEFIHRNHPDMGIGLRTIRKDPQKGQTD